MTQFNRCNAHYNYHKSLNFLSAKLKDRAEPGKDSDTTSCHQCLTASSNTEIQDPMDGTMAWSHPPWKLPRRPPGTREHGDVVIPSCSYTGPEPASQGSTEPKFPPAAVIF